MVGRDFEEIRADLERGNVLPRGVDVESAVQQLSQVVQLPLLDGLLEDNGVRVLKGGAVLDKELDQLAVAYLVRNSEGRPEIFVLADVGAHVEEHDHRVVQALADGFNKDALLGDGVVNAGAPLEQEVNDFPVSRVVALVEREAVAAGWPVDVSAQVEQHPDHPHPAA